MLCPSNADLYLCGYRKASSTSIPRNLSVVLILPCLKHRPHNTQITGSTIESTPITGIPLESSREPIRVRAAIAGLTPVA
jgi:hypothetical protein